VPNAVLQEVTPSRAQSADLAHANSGIRECGFKLRLTSCSGTFGSKLIQFKGKIREIAGLNKCNLV